MPSRTRTHFNLLLSILVTLGLIFPLAFGPAPAIAAPAEPTALDVGIVRPLSQGTSSEDLDVMLSVSSTFELKSVVVQVGNFTTTLMTPEGQVATSGRIQLDPIITAPTPITLTLFATVTDVMGNMQSAQAEFLYDHTPVIQVNSPPNFAVARPTIPISMTCTDDDARGCQSVRVSDANAPLLPLNQPPLAQGVTSISETLSLEKYSGQTMTLNIGGVDARDQGGGVTRTVYVEPSQALVEAASVDGLIWDINADAILFVQFQGDSYILKIKDRATGQETTVLADPARVPQFGYLTPAGAIFLAYKQNPAQAFIPISLLYEWRNGALVTLYETSFAPMTSYDIKVAGNFAAWRTIDEEGSRLYKYQFDTGAADLIAQGSLGNLDYAVAENGDVVYTVGAFDQLIRNRAGITTTLVNTATIFSPMTDGANVTYYQMDSASGNYIYSIQAYLSSTETSLTLVSPSEPIDINNLTRNVQLNNGWIAYAKPSPNGIKQVWRRSPAGVLEQLTFFTAPSDLESLGPNGEVVYRNQEHRYYARSNGLVTGLATEIGWSKLGKLYWIEGQLFSAIGRTLFRVVPNPILLPLVLSNAQ